MIHPLLFYFSTKLIPKIKSKRGTITVSNLVMFIVAFIVLSWFSSILLESIAQFKSGQTDPIAIMLADLVPAFILAGLMLSYFATSSTR